MAVLAGTALAHAADMKVETVLVGESHLCQRRFRCDMLVGQEVSCTFVVPIDSGILLESGK